MFFTVLYASLLVLLTRSLLSVLLVPNPVYSCSVDSALLVKTPLVFNAGSDVAMY